MENKIGLFWDATGGPLPENVDIILFASELLALGKSIGPGSHLSKCKVYAPFNFVPSSKRISFLNLGIEHVATNDRKPFKLFNDVFQFIRGAGEPGQNCFYTLLLISSSPECVSFIKAMLQRGVQVIIVASRNLVTDPLRQLANVSIELEEVMQQCLINHGSSECNSGIGSNQSGLSMSQHELDFDNDTNARSKDNTSDYKEEEIGNFVSSYHNRYEEHPIASLSNEYIQEVPVTGSQRPLCDTHSTTMSNMDVRSYVPASPHANQEHLELLEKLKQYQQTLQGSQTNELLNENFNMKSHIDNSSGVYSANNQVVGGNGGKINLINVSAPHSVVSRTSGYESNTGLSAIPSHLSGVSMHSSIDASGGSQAGLGTSRLCHPGTDEAVMYRDLEVSLKICNVRLAVSTLRKIYTRQSRLFKIPEILNELMHARLLSSVNREHSDKAIILFILSCIQWCFGIQNGEHVDSFKYKMNKNIASWLLQSISHMHHFGSPASSEIVNSAQAVVRHILESVAELDFCLEILQTFAIENAHEILRSYVTFWINSDNPVLSAKSREFAIMHGHPTTPTSSEVNMSSVPTALDGAAANIVVSAGVGIQQNGHTCVAGGVKTLERMSAEQLIALPLSKLTPDQKLFVLVARAPEGLLGARIPSLYRETFGERLRLQGRKLKDVILISNKFEMIGSDGPGDKLFRCIHPEEYAHLHENYPLNLNPYGTPQEDGAGSANHNSNYVGSVAGMNTLNLQNNSIHTPHISTNVQVVPPKPIVNLSPHVNTTQLFDGYPRNIQYNAFPVSGGTTSPPPSALNQSQYVMQRAPNLNPAGSSIPPPPGMLQQDIYSNIQAANAASMQTNSMQTHWSNSLESGNQQQNVTLLSQWQNRQQGGYSLAQPTPFQAQSGQPHSTPIDSNVQFSYRDHVNY